MFSAGTTPGEAGWPARGAPPPPAHYVPLPRRLAEDLRDSPVAIGAYALIARLYRISRAPVPLSPADLRALDPSLSHGAATRALQRLAETAYVIASRDQGRKSAYVPTWGVVRGAALPWDLAAPYLGRPRHITALRLDQRLLDTCLGRLRPHGEHPAVVERYVSQPLLGLADVGGYALALAGLAADGAGLRQLTLLDAAGAPQPLPDDAIILALASQRALHDGGDGLTSAGWARTAFAAPPSTEARAPGDVLFFVPEGQIGEGIGGGIVHPIDRASPGEPAFSSSESGNLQAHHCRTGSHGVMETHGTVQTTTTGAGRCGGGTEIPGEAETTATRGSQRGMPASTPAELPESAAVAEPDSCRLLREIGVRRSVRGQFAARPSEQVARVIRQARGRGDVRDLAAWVVSALRDLPEAAGDTPAADERPPSALPIHTHPGLSDEQRDCWIRRFRAAPSPYEQRALLARLEQEHPR